jgi:hypothetical protein
MDTGISIAFQFSTPIKIEKMKHIHVKAVCIASHKSNYAYLAESDRLQ